MPAEAVQSMNLGKVGKGRKGDMVDWGPESLPILLRFELLGSVPSQDGDLTILRSK